MLGEAAGGGGGDCAPGEGTDDGGREEQECRRAGVQFGFEQWGLGREDHPGMFGNGAGGSDPLDSLSIMGGGGGRGVPARRENSCKSTMS